MKLKMNPLCSSVVYVILVCCCPLLGVTQNIAPTTTTPIDFRVVFRDDRRVFSSNDYLNFDKLLRANDRDVMFVSRCSFGGLGETPNKVQLLKNGVVVDEHETGGVSMVGRKVLGNVEYALVNSGLHTHSMPDAYDFNPADQYQIRATCGDLISQPSEVFRVEPVGRADNNLQISIRPAQSEHHVGKRLLVEVTISNLGAEPFLCPTLRDEDDLERWGWSIVVSDFKQGVQIYDRRPPRLDAFEPGCTFDDDCVARFQRAQMEVLAPGATRSATFDLGRRRYSYADRYSGDAGSAPTFGSTAGKFLVTIGTSIDDKLLRNEPITIWRGEARSNSIILDIKRAS